MILNYPNGNPFKFFFLTSGMVDTLVRSSVPLQDLDKLAVYHGVLTYGEMADILKYQLVVGKTMGIPLTDAKVQMGTGYDAAMLADAFNSSSSDALAGQFKAATKFQSLVIGQTVVMVAGDHADKLLPSFHKQDGNTFAAALLETIYSRVGYLESHSGQVTHPALGEFTLAEVFKLLSIENP
jgi:hypothetical protein